MKKLFYILLLSLSIFLTSCNKEKKISVINEDDINLQMISLYEEGYEELLNGDILYAANKFNDAESIFPQSEWAPMASLMAAYAYYSQDYYFEAIDQIESYMKKYPNHIDMDYAHFILAMCYYENIVDEKRDLQPLLKSKKEFELIITEYPNTDFALDAKFKLELIEDKLAGKEMFVARHYLKSKKWIPAINRFKTILENYETTVYVEEALYRLVEINYRLGLIDESKKYANLLGYNYGSSEWYKASYKIFNEDYVYDYKKVKKLKQKDKRKILSKFKAKFKKIFD
ncbi:outer membrane protein assembly factor BamD [Candidatus Pelagibacter sp. Uisw_121]|uniref:outer membrane protein assembly factor BamD n=1 Tax=Candidatus Pelagibacter sp. Uisw_121 TaxID=3230987 RepID=UPI0039EBEF17|tara:strand:- start:648 stop:1505 length:858 start_codon:yes stop_codon:yes gene_type:complete